MKNKKGFTLAELLIVVAIIGVLVAVSIPVFSSQLEKARKAVDLSDMRSAKAAAAAEYISQGATGEANYYYDAASGTVITGLEAARDRFKKATDGYGRSRAPFEEGRDGGTGTPRIGDARGVVEVEVNTDGKMSAKWEPIGHVTVVGDNVSNYLVPNDPDKSKDDSEQTFTLEFGTGDLSYVTISDATVFNKLDPKQKAQVTSLVFGKNNLQIEDAVNATHGNKGFAFAINPSPWNGFSKLESIDFSGAKIATLGFPDSLYKSLKKITLSEQNLSFNLTGRWYYLNEQNQRVYLPYGLNSNKEQSRVEPGANAYGKTIYRGDDGKAPGAEHNERGPTGPLFFGNLLEIFHNTPEMPC